MEVVESPPAIMSLPDDLYRQAADAYGPALERLSAAYERDPDRRRDLVQEIHLALWRSLAGYEARCSLRTWVYRVAHSVAASWVLRQRRLNSGLVSIDQLAEMTDDTRPDAIAGRKQALERLLDLIHQLDPVDRQVILSYLEGFDAATTAEVTGLSAVNVATKIHRIKNVLSRRFHEGAGHAE